MANGVITRVKPGDLITSADFNAFADLLDDLTERVTALEGQTSAATGVTLQPLSGPVHVGDAITVNGTHIAQPVLLNVVMLGETRITQFNPGTDDTHLVFNVPDIGGLPRTVSLTVTNPAGSAAISVNVQPAAVQVPVGKIVVTAQPVNQVATVGQTISFPFLVDSQTTIPETYALSVVYSQVVGGASAADWLQRTTIRNGAGAAIQNVTIANGGPVLIVVGVTIPVGAVSASLGLHVESVHAPTDPLLKTTNVVPITVGGTVVVSDPRVHFDQLLVAPGTRLVTNDPTLGTVIKTPVGVPPAVQATAVRINSTFDVAGTYAFSGKIVPADTSKWTVALDASTPASANQGPGNPRQIIVMLSAPTIDTAQSRTLEIHATSTTPGQTFDSWFSVAIQNG